MSLKVVLNILLSAFLITFVYSIDPDFHPEEQCNRIGGICTLASNCPHKIERENIGRCPEQQSKGAECCNEIPIHLQDKCKSYGGECMANCSPRLRVTQVTDCPSGQHCCVLI